MKTIERHEPGRAKRITPVEAQPVIAKHLTDAPDLTTFARLLTEAQAVHEPKDFAALCAHLNRLAREYYTGIQFAGDAQLPEGLPTFLRDADKTELGQFISFTDLSR